MNGGAGLGEFAHGDRSGGCIAPRPRSPFAAWHKWDRNFFLTYVVLLWFGILGGFVPEIVQHVARHKPPFPLIVHVHGVVFVGWLVLLTTQVLLIRRRRADLHRKLGIAAMGLAALMVIVGPATAFYMQRYQGARRKAIRRSSPSSLGTLSPSQGLPPRHLRCATIRPRTSG